MALLSSIISAGSIGAPLSAGSIGISSTLLIGVPYSYEASRSTKAFVGKANPLIMHADNLEALTLYGKKAEREFSARRRKRWTRLFGVVCSS